jgi:dihydroflavonol-4-reductase
MKDRGKRMEDLAVVTGGAGFIGSHLVELLLQSGNLVRVIEKPGAHVAHLPPAVEVTFADIRDRGALDRAMTGARRVYHLAANPNLWARDPGEFHQVNCDGTRNVLDSALAAGAERVLHTSTESILTKSGKVDVIDENVEIAPEDTVGPYCLSKLLAEQYAFSLALRGLPIVVANPTMPVGPGDRGLSPPTRLILDFCRGRLPAAMDCTLNLIDVRDAALGIDLVMQRGTPGRRYLLGATNVSLMGLFERLSRLTGVPVPRWKVPYSLGLAVAAVSELWANHVTGRMPQATMTGLRLARRLMHFDPSRSLAELGLRPRVLDQSLHETITWLHSAGLLADGRRRGGTPIGPLITRDSRACAPEDS